MAPKQLVLMRHAKSSWADPGCVDHDRKLNARGRDAAVRIGRYLRERGIRPDLVLCSSSVRTRQTLERLALPDSTDISIEADLYAASAQAIVTRVRRVDASVRSVLLIGHNPGIHEAAYQLAESPDAVPERFPTAALVDLELTVDVWDHLEPGSCRLVRYVSPRDLA